ncbi:MAG: 3'-5' exonuclease [Dehalococcoidia bacterium]|nr:3'-5' exonuclease [Dehalococcoidia bacterium]
MRETLIFTDLETGGIAEHCPIIQIGAVAVRQGRELATYEAKLQFMEEDCEAEALELNSYDRELWAREALGEKDALQGFGAFLSRFATVRKVSKAGNNYFVARMVGFNSSTFDFPRLRARYAAHDVFFPGDFHGPDVMQLAYWYFVAAGNWPEKCSMESLCRMFKVQSGRHDALGDARATVELARKLFAKLHGGGNGNGRPHSGQHGQDNQTGGQGPGHISPAGKEGGAGAAIPASAPEHRPG